MKKKKRKKIQTLCKEHKLEHSSLYRLTILNKLFEILNLNKEQAHALFEKSDDYYNQFQNGNRAIQAPFINNCLDLVQNRLASLLYRIITPSYLHSTRGKSYISNAEQHSLKKEILSIDISSFFPSTSKLSVFKFFRNKLECSHEISNYLAKICTINNHIPTGSQLSSHLAFFSNIDMFEKLHALSQHNDLQMTVYVDDITFSGESIPKNFEYEVKLIINNFKLNINKKKTRYSRNGAPIRITGVTLYKNKILVPNSFMKKLHESLVDWKKIIKTNTSVTIVKKQYIKLISLINHTIQIGCGNLQLKSKIKNEYIEYKKLHCY